MRICRFSIENSVMPGVETNGRIIDLNGAVEYYFKSRGKAPEPGGSFKGDAPNLFEMWEKNEQIARQAIDHLMPVLHKQGGLTTVDGKKIVYDTKEVVVKPPVSHCSNFIGIGVNYKSHLEETKQPRPEFPIFFFKTSSSIIGQGDPIVLTRASKLVDYEAELGVIIGKRAKNVTRDRAYDYVAGYTIVNDITDRGVLIKAWGQLTYLDWFLAKAQDGFAPLGPCVVSRDEIADPHNLNIQLKLNEKIVQNSNTGEMILKIPEIIEFITTYITLQPGDIIATGTPAGVGLFTGNILKDGDVIEASVEKIGSLKSTVVNEN